MTPPVAYRRVTVTATDTEGNTTTWVINDPVDFQMDTLMGRKDHGTEVLFRVELGRSGITGHRA